MDKLLEAVHDTLANTVERRGAVLSHKLSGQIVRPSLEALVVVDVENKRPVSRLRQPL